ncbi:uncharacterized protein [Centruroides vittatus]|uniref:uncharacterized protein isoform X1 n=1 Tax=Centruroides vittatus TaxID=120091 RepID=UPI0035107B5B
MSDQEQLAISHAFPPINAGSSAVSANTALTSTTLTPPYAPYPKQPKGTTLERNNVPELPLTASDECNIHEVCYYFQQILFIAAILTGTALVVAGAIMHIQSGEWLVFVYIGVLLAGVNMVLLLIQCYIRKQQKQRTKLHYTVVRQRSGAVQYNPLGTNNQMPATLGSGRERHKPKQGHLNLVQPPFKEFSPVSSTNIVQSPTDSHKRAMFLMPSPSYRSGPSISHHRQAKEIHPRSPSLVHRPIHRSVAATGGSQLPLSRYENSPQESHLPPVPPPSYDDLICIGHLPQDGTSVHLI